MLFGRFCRVFCLVSCQLFAFVPAALADTVFLANGDRLSGEVVVMEEGKLTLETGYAGTLKIDFGQVERIESEKGVRVFFGDRTDAKGTEVARENGRIRVTNGNEPVSRPAEEVATINEPLDDWDLTVDLAFGWNKSEGNTDNESTHAQISGKARRLDDRFRLYGDYNWARDDGKRSAYNWKVMPEYDRFLDERFYWNVNSLAQRDYFKGLKLRTLLGTGPGYQLFDTSSLKLSGQVGVAWVDEDYYDKKDRDYTAGQWGIDFSWWAYKRYVQLYHHQNGFLSLEDANNWIVQTRSGVRLPVMESFFTQFELGWDYENDPEGDRKRSDTKYIFSVGYTFGN